VDEVTWLRNITRVRGVTPRHSVSTISSAVVTGSGIDWRTRLATGELPDPVHRAVFVIGGQDFVTGMQLQRARDIVDPGRGIRDENQVAWIGVKVSAQTAARLFQQGVGLLREKQGGLPLKLKLHALVDVEDRSGAGTISPVVEVDYVRFKQEL
jgi:hypothetical protein